MLQPEMNVCFKQKINLFLSIYNFKNFINLFLFVSYLIVLSL